MTPTERNAVLEEAAKACERCADWSEFGNGIGQWDGGPDASLDYKLGIVAARAHSAAAIRALKEPKVAFEELSDEAWGDSWDATFADALKEQEPPT